MFSLASRGVLGVGVALTIALATAIIASPPRIGRAWMIWFLVAWFVANVPDLITYIFFAAEDHWRSEFVLSAALLVVSLGFVCRLDVAAFASWGSPIGDVFASTPAPEPFAPVVSWWRDPRPLAAPVVAIALALVAVPLHQFDFITSTFFGFSDAYIGGSVLVKIAALLVVAFLADKVGGYRLCIAGTVTAIALAIAFIAMDQARLEHYTRSPVEGLTQVLILVSCAAEALGLVMMIPALTRPWIDIASALIVVAYLLPRYHSFALIDDIAVSIECLAGAAVLATAVTVFARRRALAA